MKNYAFRDSINPEDYFIAGKRQVSRNVKEISVFMNRLMVRGINKSTLLHPKPTVS